MFSQKESVIENLTSDDLRKLLTDPKYRPSTLSELCSALRARGGDKKKVQRFLHELMRSGEAVKLRNQRFVPARPAKTVEGKLQYNRRGFGFVVPDDGSEDIFVPGEGIGGALHGDRVSVEVEEKTQGRGRQEGRVREVLTRGIRTLVGQIRFREDRTAYLTPFGQEIPYTITVATPLPSDFNPDEDPVVAVTIDWKGSTGKELRGNLAAVLGPLDDPKIDSLMVIFRNNIPKKFPNDAVEEANRIPETISDSDLAGRTDLRNLPFVTIDGADARDHDDAVTLDREGNLWVAIADVAHYVYPDRPLDREAASRGNSFYFPDRVVPMLPERLSNNLCSLRPNEDRLALAAKLRISPDGALTKTELFEVVIRSRARLTYEGVDRELSGRDIDSAERLRGGTSRRPGGTLPPKSERSGSDIPDDLLPMLSRMRELSQTMFKKRMSEGGIDFDLSETKVVLDDHGSVTAMARRERTPAQQIVEEFMLAANKGVAHTLDHKGFPVIFRVHEKPDARKLADFIYLLRAYGYTVSFDCSKADPIELDRLLHRFDKDPRGEVFSFLALRSMRQACYSPQNLGHYGLGFRDYLHFTSPIRRYADLVVHRMVRAFLQKKGTTEPSFPKNYGTLENISAYISSQERLAQTAEREVRLLKGIRFLSGRKKETFKGTIVGIVSQGMFVALDEHAVEGFLHVKNLGNDQFDLFEREKLLRGRRHGKTVRLGDRVTVRVEEASIPEFRLNFSVG
ncbi:MAG: RNB domain-containing ribonuclease [Pseudomonadota bacterium]